MRMGRVVSASSTCARPGGLRAQSFAQYMLCTDAHVACMHDCVGACMGVCVPLCVCMCVCLPVCACVGVGARA